MDAPAPPPEIDFPPEFLAEYEVLSELGHGGMSYVFLARQKNLDRRVAIKLLRVNDDFEAEDVERLVREGRVLASMHHPRILGIYGAGSIGELPYLVCELIEGESLAAWVEREKTPLRRALEIVHSVADALTYAHEHGTAHRDVKPENILLLPDGEIKLADFGLARQMAGGKRLTADGMIIGTPSYMSPEQIQGPNVGPESDQYSLGIVAYEMLTGRKPFDGATYAEIITQHLFETPPDLRELRPDVPAHVAETIARMLSKDAAARFPDLDAAVSALGMPSKTQGDVARTQLISLARSGPEKKIRMSVPVSPVPSQKKKPAAKTVVESTVATEPGKSHGMRVVLMTLGVVVLLAGGVGGTWAYMSRKSAPQQQVGANTTPPAAPVPGAAVSNAAGTTPVSPDAAKQDSTAGATSAPSAPSKPEATKTETGKPVKNKLEDKRLAVRNDKTAKPATPVPDIKVSDASKNAATQQQSTQAAAPAPAAAAAPPPAPVAVPTSITGSIRIGSTTDGAILFINGAASSTPVTGGTKTIPVTSKDGNVHLKISAAGCSVAWDTTITIVGGQTTTVGRRNPTCP